MELEVECRRPVGRPKNTLSKTVEEDMRKICRGQKTVEATHITSNPRSGKLGTINEDDDDDDDDLRDLKWAKINCFSSFH